MRLPRIPLLLLLALALAFWGLLLLPATASASAHHDHADHDDGAPDTWAVLACTSRFWFNYRHVANALAVYQTLRRLGLPDARIVLMLADDMPCNARNARAGTVFKAVGHDADLCAGGIEVDYKGNEVTVENFLRVLTGRHGPGTPLSRQLGSGPRSRVLVYMTGHGGDEFLKFHNHEEVGGQDLAGALAEMRAGGRFGELFFIVDTCQGGTLFRPFRTENVLAVGSSAKGENSYAHQNDLELGVALVDRFTDATSDYINMLADRIAPLRPIGGTSTGRLHMQQPPQQLPRVREYLQQVPLARLLESYQPAQLKSRPVVRTDLHYHPNKRPSSMTSSNTHGLPSIAAFFSDAARVRVLPLPATERVLSQLQLSRGGRRPGQEQKQEEDVAAAWTQIASIQQGFGCHPDHGQEQQQQQQEAWGAGAPPASTLPWLWVALGLVGVGLTTGRGDGDGKEGEQEE